MSCGGRVSCTTYSCAGTTASRGASPLPIAAPSCAGSCPSCARATASSTTANPPPGSEADATARSICAFKSSFSPPFGVLLAPEAISSSMPVSISGSTTRCEPSSLALASSSHQLLASGVDPVLTHAGGILGESFFISLPS